MILKITEHEIVLKRAIAGVARSLRYVPLAFLMASGFGFLAITPPKKSFSFWQFKKCT